MLFHFAGFRIRSGMTNKRVIKKYHFVIQNSLFIIPYSDSLASGSFIFSLQPIAHNLSPITYHLSPITHNPFTI